MRKKGGASGEVDTEAKQKLEQLGKHLVAEIDAGISPSFESPLRGSSNVQFDNKEGVLMLGDKREKRVFLNVAQAKKFMQTVAVASKCKKFKEENLHTSIRGLFYQLKFTLGEDIEEELFEEQAESVHPDDPLLVRIGDRFSITTGASALADASSIGRTIPGNPSIKINGVSASAPSFDKNQKIGEHTVRSFIKHIHPRQMLHITTRSGREVRVTPAHSLFTMNELGELLPIKAGVLKKGSRIAVPRYIDIKENAGDVDLYTAFKKAPPEVIKKLYLHLDRASVLRILRLCNLSKVKYITRYQWKKHGRLPLSLLYENKIASALLQEEARISIVGGRHKYPVSIRKSEELGKVLGYLLSEGSNSINMGRDGARSVAFSNSSKEVICDFADAFSKVFGKIKTSVQINKKVSRGKSFSTMRLNVGYDLLSFILEYAFDYPAGMKSWDKTVPSIILDAPLECVRGFVKAYVKGDGSYQRSKRESVIRVYSSSRSMINALSFLLLRLRIFPRICKAANKGGKHQKYILYVGSKDYVKKLNEITSSFKTKRLDAGDTNTDLFPVRKLIMRAKEACRIPDSEYKKINFYPKTEYVTRSKIGRVIELIEKHSTGKENPYIAKLRNLIESDIYLDEVKEIKHDFAPYTFDLSVVDGDKPIENFVGGFGWICLHNSNELVEDLEVALGVKREDLNLSTDRKGVVAGPLVIKDKFGGSETVIDCTKQGRSGWMIPSDVDNGMEFVKCDADYVLVIEKDALWQRLNEDQFWKKENCIIITPKGQASRGCRRLIRKLADLKLPIFCFMDCDAWGWYIYWTIKTGSMNLAYLGKEIATPEAKFIGVTMRDITTYDFLKKLTIRAKEVDIKRAEEMLSYPWIAAHKEWVDELKTVLETKKKLEQDALQGPRLTFVGEYIKEKIKKKDFLP